MPQEQLNLKITFDESGAVTAVESLAKATTAAGKKIGDTGKQSQSAIDNISKSLKSFTDKIKNAFGELVVGFGTSIMMVKKVIGAFEEAEKANTALRNAFEKTVVNVDEAMRAFSDFASAQQLVTKYDDEIIKSSAALFVQLNRLSGEALKNATKAAMDFATAQKMDLNSAIEMISQSAEGSRNSFRKFGLELDDSMSKSEKMTVIVGFLNDKFGGFAEKEGKSAAGQMAIMSHQIDEVYENLGSNLMPILTPFLKMVVSIVEGIGKLPAPVKMATFAIAALVPVVLSLNAAWGVTGLVITGIVTGMTLLTAAIGNSASATEKAKVQTFENNQQLRYNVDALKISIRKLEEYKKSKEDSIKIGFMERSTLEAAGITEQKMQGIKSDSIELDKLILLQKGKLKITTEAYNKSNEKAKDVSFALTGAKKEQSAATDKLTDSINKQNTALAQLNDDEKKFIDEITKKNNDSTNQKIAKMNELLATDKLTTEQRLLLLQISSEMETARKNELTAINIQKDQEYFDNRTALMEQDLMTTGEYLAQIDARYGESSIWRQEAEEKVLNKVIENMSKAVGYANNYASSINSIYSGMTQARINQLTRENNEFQLKLEDRKKKGLLTEEEYQNEKKKADLRTRQEIAKNERKTAWMARAAALFEIAANTAIAIAKAYAASVVTFGMPWSGAAAVAGALQTAAVLMQPLPEIPTFAKGGTVRGYGGVDSQMIRATPGETMLNPAQSENLFNALQENGLLGNNNRVVNNNNTITNNADKGMRYIFNAPVYVSGDKSFEKQVNNRLSQGGDFI